MTRKKESAPKLTYNLVTRAREKKKIADGTEEKHLAIQQVESRTNKGFWGSWEEMNFLILYKHFYQNHVKYRINISK